MNNIRVRMGSGWKTTKRFHSLEALILDCSDNDGSFCRVCLDMKSGSIVRLPAGDQKPIRGANYPLLFNSTSNELIYPVDEGIAAYDLNLHKDRLIVRLDRESQQVYYLQLSPRWNCHSVYVVGVPVRNLPMGSIPQHLQIRHVYLSEGPSDQPRLLGQLSLPLAVDIDWDKELLFASVQGNKIVTMDLQTGKVDVVRNTKTCHLLCISPRSTLITWELFPRKRLIPWGVQYPHIEETLETGQIIPLTDFGWYPAFSPDGTMLAFTVGHSEVWLKRGSDKPEKILSLPSVESYDVTNTPTWCPCGQHFAVRLDAPDMSPMRRPLVIINVADKEVVVRDDVLHKLGGRVWVPRELISPLLKDKDVVTGT